MLSRTEQQFFALLRGGLWETPPDPSLFAGGADWSRIYTLAGRQTVFGLVGDGIALEVAHPGIAEADKVPVEFRKKFLVQVVKAERRNELLNSFLVRYNAIFSAAGIVPVIVKGQGIAQAYRIPSHRQSGDIDYLLTPEEYAKARSIVEPLATEIEREDTVSLHYNCTVEGITVELHGSVFDHTSPRLSVRLAEFLAENRARPLRYWELGGERIPLMNHHFTAIYVLQHFHHHMLTSGVGLRQICDWVMYLASYGKELDMDALERDLRRLSLLRPWKVYAALAVDLLGIDPEQMPLYDPSYSRYTRAVWHAVDKTGNFGKFDAARPVPGMPLLERKLMSFIFTLRQSGRLLGVFPREALRVLVRRTVRGLGRLNRD